MNIGPFTLSYDKRLTAPLLITLILLGGHFTYGILENYWQLVAAIGTAFVLEEGLSRIMRGRWRNAASAYITGISVSILIRSPFLWPYALCAALSITSKYAIQFKDRHIFNPSNFGICAMLFLASEHVAPLSIQWGNYLWPMLIIWIVGSVTIWRIKRFHICATYVISFLVFALLRSQITGDPLLAEIAPITGPMYQLFVFFMITDPATTVHRKWGQYVVPFAIALVEMFFRLGEVIYAPFYALFIVGPIAMMLELWWDDRQQRRADEMEQASAVS